MRPYSSDANDTLGLFYLGNQVLVGRRPMIPEIQHSELELQTIRIMEACWAQDPKDRPPFIQILKDIENLYTEAKGKKK